MRLDIRAEYQIWSIICMASLGSKCNAVSSRIAFHATILKSLLLTTIPHSPPYNSDNPNKDFTTFLMSLDASQS
jgi:hypothetical protein